jgi:hypothetical protein
VCVTRDRSTFFCPARSVSASLSGFFVGASLEGQCPQLRHQSAASLRCFACSRSGPCVHPSLHVNVRSNSHIASQLTLVKILAECPHCHCWETLQTFTSNANLYCPKALSFDTYRWISQKRIIRKPNIFTLAWTRAVVDFLFFPCRNSFSFGRSFYRA